MQTITTSKGSYIFVEVPKDSKYHKVEEEYLFYDIEEDLFTKHKQLPFSGYTFLCTTDTITEEIAKGIVESNGENKPISYVNYLSIDAKYLHSVNGKRWTSLNSFHSLLELHNLSPDKIYAICKQNTI